MCVNRIHKTKEPMYEVVLKVKTHLYQCMMYMSVVELFIYLGFYIAFNTVQVIS